MYKLAIINSPRLIGYRISYVLFPENFSKNATFTDVNSLMINVS